MSNHGYRPFTPGDGIVAGVLLASGVWVLVLWVVSL